MSEADCLRWAGGGVLVCLLLRATCLRLLGGILPLPSGGGILPGDALPRALLLYPQDSDLSLFRIAANYSLDVY